MGNRTQTYYNISKIKMSLRKALFIAATHSRNISSGNGSAFLVQEYLIHSPNGLNNNSQKITPTEEISGYVLNKSTGVQEIKVFKSREIKTEQDTSPYEFLVNKNFQFQK